MRGSWHLIIARTLKRMRRGFLFVVVLSLMATACSTSDDPDASEDENAPSELVVLGEDIPAGLNYDGPSVGHPPSQTGIVNLMEGLITYAEGDTNDEGVRLMDFSQFEGALAESWDFDEETLTWTFRLREGVKGCEGATFNADDVLYTLARAKAVAGEVDVGWFEFGQVGKVEGFTADVFEEGADTSLGDSAVKVDDYTVEIKQSEPSSLFLPVLAQWAGVMIFDKETMEENATEDDPWSHEYANNENAPSFGPYCLESWDKSREIVFQANPDYFLGPPAIDRVVYRKVPDSSTRLTAVRSGDADVALNLTPRELDSLEGVEGTEVAGVYGNETVFVHLDWAAEPFDDPRVRQAISYGIPYDDIISTAYLGAAQKWNGQVPSSYPGYCDTDATYEFDPDRAAELLAEAGFPNGEGLEEFSKSFVLSFAAERGEILEPVGTLIRDSLRDLGMPVELNPLPAAQYDDRLKNKKDIPFGLDDEEKPVPVDAGYGLLISHATDGVGCCANHTHFSNPKLDDMILAINRESDPATREEMMCEVQNELMGLPNWVPVVERKTQWAFQDNVNGILWYPNNSLRWYDLSLEG